MLLDIFLNPVHNGFATKGMSLAPGGFALGDFSFPDYCISHDLALSHLWVPPETDPTSNTDKLCAHTGISQSPHVPASPPRTTCGHSGVCGR